MIFHNVDTSPRKVPIKMCLKIFLSFYLSVCIFNEEYFNTEEYEFSLSILKKDIVTQFIMQAVPY